MWRFLEPVLEGTIVINDNFRDHGKEEVQVAYNEIFVVEIGVSMLALVLAAGCEHLTIWGVMLTSNDLP
jgi:hypothetical protein